MGIFLDIFAVGIYYRIGPGKKIRKKLTDLLEISWTSSYEEIRKGRDDKFSDTNIKKETKEEIERLYSKMMR